jgi:hypothetical protein
MKRRPTVAVLVFLLAALELPAGLSLCIAADGHSTIELAHAASPCTSHFQRHHPGAATVEANHLDDHTCRDVPLLEGSARRDAPSSHSVSAEAHALIHSACAIGARPPIRAPLPTAARALGARTTERSVVLLI